MAYEELTIHAIQRKDKPGFAERFRLFPDKRERDKTLEFIKENEHPSTADEACPVILRIIVKTEAHKQQELGFEEPENPRRDI
jgi:hypothetical protein